MAHYNISGNLHNGIAIPAGSEIDSVNRNTRVEINEVVDESTLEIILADPVNMAEREVSVSGDGPVGIILAPADIADPSTLTLTRAEISEPNPNNRCTFSVRGSSMIAFNDTGGAVADVGAEPTIADLEIRSVEYSAAESVRRSTELTDLTLVGTTGEPIERATVTPKGTFAINGRGDVPVGVGLGTGGASFKGCSTGKVVVGNFGESEKRGDWNGWNTDGRHDRSAAVA